MTTRTSYYRQLLMRRLTDTYIPHGQRRKNNIASPPLYFVRSGWINISESRVNAVGQSGLAWGSTAYPNNQFYAKYFYFSDKVNSVDFLHTAERYHAFPVLCPWG